jgi:hypothetical protein
MVQVGFVLLTFLSLLALLVALPIACFSPAKWTKPWMVVSVLSALTLIFATIYVLLGYGWGKKIQNASLPLNPLTCIPCRSGRYNRRLAAHLWILLFGIPVREQTGSRTGARIGVRKTKAGVS